jgi:ParB/RepB/Spo0J family partition protein
MKQGRLESPPALPTGIPADRTTYYDVEPDPGPQIDPLGTSPTDAAVTLPEAANNPELAEPEVADGVVTELSPDLIDDSPYQPEDEEGDRYAPVGIAELASAFATAGQTTPIRARRRPGGRFEIIAGHRRVRAARLRGMRVKAIICTMTDREAALAVMADNAGVKGKTDYQKAKLYKAALDQGYAVKYEEVAAIFATSKASITKRLSMMRLPAPILALLNADPKLFGATTAGVLHDLLAEHPEHVELITQAVERLKEPGVTENSIKPWVSQMIAAKLSGPAPVDDERMNTRVITDSKKRSLYTARLRGRVVTIRLNGTAIDPQQVLDRLAEVLETDAKLVSTDEK